PPPAGQGLGEVGWPPRAPLPGIPAALPHLMGGRSGTRAFPGRLPDPILSSPSAPPPPRARQHDAGPRSGEGSVRPFTLPVAPPVQNPDNPQKPVGHVPRWTLPTGFFRVWPPHLRAPRWRCVPQGTARR